MQYSLNINETYGFGSVMERNGLREKSAAAVALARMTSPITREFLETARNWIRPDTLRLDFSELDRVEKLHDTQMILLRCLVLHLNTTSRKPLAEELPYSYQVTHGFPLPGNERSDGRSESRDDQRTNAASLSLKILRDDGSGVLREFCTLMPRADLFKKFEKALLPAFVDAYVMEMQMPGCSRPSGRQGPDRGGFGLRGGK